MTLVTVPAPDTLFAANDKLDDAPRIINWVDRSGNVRHTLDKHRRYFTRFSYESRAVEMTEANWHPVVSPKARCYVDWARSVWAHGFRRGYYALTREMPTLVSKRREEWTES